MAITLLGFPRVVSIFNGRSKAGLKYSLRKVKTLVSKSLVKPVKAQIKPIAKGIKSKYGSMFFCFKISP